MRELGLVRVSVKVRVRVRVRVSVRVSVRELGLETIEDGLAQRRGDLAAHARHRAADGVRLRLDLRSGWGGG